MELTYGIRHARACLALFFALCLAGRAAAEKPNIVFILADDLGYTDLGVYGSSYYKTPNIDQMAAQGMRFTDGYACGPNCQPTRAALMTGLYSPRTGIYTVGHIDRFDWRSRSLRPTDNVEKLKPDFVTFAEALRDVGYATGMFGKWHLGEDDEHCPIKQGFQEAITSAGKHFGFETRPPAAAPKEAYLADYLTERALDFISRQHKKPFLLYLPHFAVHAPYEAKPELIEEARKNKPGGGHRNPVYAAMIASLDVSVGRILAHLEELKLSEKTLVIFSSDNGGVGGYAREGLRGAGEVTDNAPLRGGKGMLYEGGIRVPWIFRWPGRIAAGTICSAPILSVDLFPTLLELAGAEAPKNQPLDGASLADTLTSSGRHAPRRGDLFWHFPGYLGAGKDSWRTTPASVIRSGPWKLIEFLEDGRLELYHLKNDPGEQANLAGRDPDRTKLMKARLDRWRSEVRAPMPQRIR